MSSIQSGGCASVLEFKPSLVFLLLQFPLDLLKTGLDPVPLIPIDLGGALSKLKPLPGMPRFTGEIMRFCQGNMGLRFGAGFALSLGKQGIVGNIGLMVGSIPAQKSSGQIGLAGCEQGLGIAQGYWTIVRIKCRGL